MSKLLEIREYDNITYNKDYKEDSSYFYLEKEVFIEFEEFILDLKNKSDSGADAEAIEFLDIKIKKNIGKVISAKNYIGLIQMKNGYRIQILPKITSSNPEQTKKIFLQMLISLKDFPSKVFIDTALKTYKMDLYEVFIKMYIEEVRYVVKKGIRSSYTSIEKNEKFYKGKLLVKEQILKNTVHKERFFVQFDEFNTNRPENKLIKSTLIKLLGLSTNYKNIAEIRKLLIDFDLVQTSMSYEKDFACINIDRSNKDYSNLMIWSKVFLMDNSFTTFAGNTQGRALLFPMERLFESYIGKELKTALNTINCKISLQDKGCYLFDNPKQFSLRPDIVITRSDGRKIILDTKWKLLWKNSNRSYGISQSDMYQMYAYSKKYNALEIWLLYPLTEEIIDPDIIRFESDDNVLVKIFFVDLTNIEHTMNQLVERLDL